MARPSVVVSRETAIGSIHCAAVVVSRETTMVRCVPTRARADLRQCSRPSSTCRPGDWLRRIGRFRTPLLTCNYRDRAGPAGRA